MLIFVIYISAFSRFISSAEGKRRSSTQAKRKQHDLKGGSSLKQHALKGQKLLAQGIALGVIAISKAPCKGKSFVNCLILKAFALTGRVGLTCIYKISYQILFGFTVEYVLVRKKFFYEKSVKVSFFC